MHELGHNLKLRHAGSTDLPHCKPNYLSVMNYAFQFPTILTGSDWPMDYSHNVITSLKESALVENAGIGLAQPSTLKTAVGHSIPPSSHVLPHVLKTTANNLPTNYNWYTGDTDTNDVVSSSITNLHFFPCNDNDVANTAVGGKLFGYDDVHSNSLVFWSTGGTFQNGSLISVGLDEGITGSISQAESTDPKNSVAKSNVTIPNQSILQSNDTLPDILEDPNLPPCDVTDPNCQDSPCDKEDPNCVPNTNHNFTDPNAVSFDVGNRTLVRELTLSDVMKVINAKVFDINEYIQSLNATQFVNGTDVPKLKLDLGNSLVNSSDSLYALINSSKSDQALGKLFKLRSMVDGIGQNEVILPPWNVNVLNQVDDLILAIQSKK